MANEINARETLAKGYAGENAEVEPKEAEKKLSPAALLSQAYAEAYPDPKKSENAVSVEITKTKTEGK